VPSITPFLWFTGQAEEAANFYVATLKNSRITSVTRYGEAGPGPVGSVMMVEFELDGQPVMAINDAQESAPPPSEDFLQGKIALFATCETQAEVDELWEKLSEGGKKLPCDGFKTATVFTGTSFLRACSTFWPVRTRKDLNAPCAR
jgi:predicted 3-demethylubiquinone-9 3-methyltransferase (glyoxalase superfamily)